MLAEGSLGASQAWRVEGPGRRMARGRCLTDVDVLLSTSVSATDYPQCD
jgi:hypothetical protein